MRVEPRLQILKHIVYLLCLLIKLAKVVGEDLMSGFYCFVSLADISNLETDKAKSELAFSSADMILAQVHFEKDKHVS